MYDLDKEVDTWCKASHARRCNRSHTVAELKDHLYCEIERLQAEGKSDEEAFIGATKKLGAAEDLNAEFSKNTSIFSAACENTAAFESTKVRKELRKMRMAHSIIWAALMLASTLVLVKNNAAESAAYLLILVYIPLWLVSDHLLRRAQRARLADEQ